VTAPATRGAEGAAPAIEIAGLAARLGGTEVLSEVSLTVPRQQVLCVIGPSGSGKSTLLRCVAGLETRYTGTLDIFGRSRRARGGLGQRLGLTPAPDRHEVGMVFQNFNLWPHMTALDNVARPLVVARRAGRAAARERAEATLAKVGLGDKGGQYPAQLSGGQQQRVGIARALALEPRIMLFDEATSALDPELANEVLHVMRGLAEDGMTMVVVTHEITFAARVGDRLVFMDGGRVLEDGAPRALLETPKHDRTRQFLSALRHDDF
jgi:polar amino acid transport system ATP-binding protein